MSGGRVLIVDDQPRAIRVIELALTRHGYSVESARDGMEALTKLRHAPFDVVITDLEMPRMTGRSLCEAITAEVPDPRPLVLIVTGKLERDVQAWASHQPATEVLEKPLSLQRLVKRLQAHFGGALVTDGSAA